MSIDTSTLHLSLNYMFTIESKIEYLSRKKSKIVLFNHAEVKNKRLSLIITIKKHHTTFL